MESTNEILVGSFDLNGAPSDMPIAGLILIVWREIAAMVDRESREDNMTERLMDVLDNAIAGATTVPDSVYGVARTLAYADQVAGVVHAPGMWRKFVDDVAALIDADRRRVGMQFVVRIGQVPMDRRQELEQVTRRFAHPRVTYRA